MPKKFIIKIGYQSFSVDSATAASQAMAALAKLQPVNHNTEASDPDHWFYEPEEGRHRGFELLPNQPFREPKKESAPKPLALPKPKRGSILCICEKSHVAPRESCPHCGRPFSESHNRTHGSAIQSHPTLRLL